jgi:hypothetical protein
LTGGTTGAEIPQHHAEMRRWLQAHHPTFADIPIGHNENVPGTATLWAGATLGALAGAERAGAVMAVHSNWGAPHSSCSICGALPTDLHTMGATISISTAARYCSCLAIDCWRLMT